MADEFETWAEKLERCDVYTDGGAIHRSMMLMDEITRRNGGRKLTPEEYKAAKAAMPREERMRIYLAGLMAQGRTEAEARDILDREAKFFGEGSRI